ncbi:hypothetical protein BDZ91DRAFT_829672 [Kalaharituber pfeilii]|nr:hypothetical protein BDZ91DRAFT_829672 [Kalaharituber pfeilii]
MPSPSGGKNAIAIPASAELMLVSAYTILVGGAFMAWWILIAVAVRKFTPERFRDNKVIKRVAAWYSTEPFQAAYIMAKFCFTAAIRKYRKSKTRCSEEVLHFPDTQDWTELMIALVIMLLALATVVGGIVVGVYLPGKLVIGRVAPVNGMKVFTIPYELRFIWNSDILRVEPFVTSKIAERAFSAIDSSAAALESHLSDRVNVQQIPRGEGPAGEKDYQINYSFQVNSYDMGLQHLHGLSVTITGNCSFEYDWYTGLKPGGDSSHDIDEYNLFGIVEPEDQMKIHVPITDIPIEPFTRFDGRQFYSDNISSLPFAILPNTQGRWSTSTSLDPWYRTDIKDLSGQGSCNYIRPGRPPLHCNERRAWNYRGSYLGPDLAIYYYNATSTTWSRRRFTGANVPDIPLGLWTLLCEIPSTGNVGAFLSYQRAGLLESSQRVLARQWDKETASDIWIVDAATSTAYRDITRMVNAAYLSWRNVLRDRVLAYVDVQQLGLEGTVPNGVRDHENRNPLPGTGDFVVPSENVRTLCLEALVAVPAVVAVSWIVVWVVTDRNIYKLWESVAG